MPSPHSHPKHRPSVLRPTIHQTQVASFRIIDPHGNVWLASPLMILFSKCYQKGWHACSLSALATQKGCKLSLNPDCARHAERLPIIHDYLTSNSLAVGFSMAIRQTKPEPQVDSVSLYFWGRRGTARWEWPDYCLDERSLPRNILSNSENLESPGG